MKLGRASVSAAGPAGSAPFSRARPQKQSANNGGAMQR